MEIKVIAHPKSKIARIKTDEHGQMHVYVNQPAVEDKANNAIIAALAEHFKLAKSKIVLVKGLKSKNKTFVLNVKK